MGRMDRRQALKVAITTTAVAGLGVAGVVPAYADNRDMATLGRDPHLPDVAGMRGDRRANELWYVYNQTFRAAPPTEVQAAYRAIGEIADGSVAGVLALYRESRRSGTYPRGFVKRVAPARAAFATLSRLQLAAFGRYYRHHDLTRPFLYLGEGSLYDPRMPGDSKVHMLDLGPNGEPTEGWHLWHAVNRAMILLGIDSGRWCAIDPLVGLGWSAQSIAEPKPDAVNPPLDRRTADRLIRQWRHRDANEIDVAFDSFPYPADIN